MRICAVILLLFGVTACVDWPDLGPAEVAQDGRWPQLLPFDAFDESSSPRLEDGDGEALAARAAGLRARAAILRRPVADDAAFEAIRQRMARF